MPNGPSSPGARLGLLQSITPSGTVTLAARASQVFSCTLATNATTPAVTEIVGTGSGTSPLGNGTYCTDPAKPPANTFCEQDERVTAKSVAILPGTDINISANPAVAKDGNNVTLDHHGDQRRPAPSGFSASLALADVGVASPNGDCDAELADNSGAPDSKAGGDTDNLLEPGESWVWTCVAQVVGLNDLTVQVTGTGTVLSGTARPKRASAAVDVVTPSTELNVTASALITYTFVETDDGDVALHQPTAGQRNSFISVAAASVRSAAPAYVSGDTRQRRQARRRRVLDLYVPSDPCRAERGHGIDVGHHRRARSRQGRHRRRRDVVHRSEQPSSRDAV